MKKEPLNILLIGLGPHAKRIYIPILKSEQSNFVGKIVGIDLKSKETDVKEYLASKNYTDIQTFFLTEVQASIEMLHPELEELLNNIVSENNISGIIIATEPMAHMVYAKWALSRNICVLMDKPISTQANVSTNMAKAEELLQNYELLVKLYQKAKKINPNLLFSLMAQRRYHPAFKKVKELINEITLKTNCPVTSIQSFHSDGQWRLPNEIIDLDYHSYNQGYGKASHSGYHFFDIVPWLIEAGESENNTINNVDIYSNFLRPLDFLKQFNLDDYTRLFPQFNDYNKYSTKELEFKMAGYGEIDAFNSFAFKSGKDTVTLGSINLVHNGFSQRGWLDARNKDLYKGNGRVRHESHIIEQGPFQAIYYQSYQSEEILNDHTSHHDVGGEYHLDIQVFRNSKLFPQWKSYKKINFRDLGVQILDGYSRGHQEDARRDCILEFLNHIQVPNKNRQFISELNDHKRGAILLSGIYQSAVKRIQNMNSMINMSFEKL